MAEPHSCPCPLILLPSQEADRASLPGAALDGRRQRPQQPELGGAQTLPVSVSTSFRWLESCNA